MYDSTPVFEGLLLGFQLTHRVIPVYQENDMDFFKTIGNVVGDVAKFVVTAPAKLTTEPVRIISQAVGFKPISDVINTVHEVHDTVVSHAVNKVIQQPIKTTVTALKIVDHLAKGETKEALNETKNEVLNQVIASKLSTPVDAIKLYLSNLQVQAKSKWQKLPEKLIEILKPYYKFDLSSVRFAENIDTRHGQAITFEYQIFFPKAIDLTEEKELWWMLHELQHTQQYNDKGGLEQFLLKYSLDAIGQTIKQKSFFIHDDIELEKEADAKANSNIKTVHEAYVQSKTLRP
jgi:hypothetical protein